MAHMMEADDTMFSAREIRPWHYDEHPDQVQLIKDAPNSVDALRYARLNWKVNSDDVFVNGSIVDGYKANVRSDTKSVLGIVSDRYRVVQNEDAFSFTDALISGDVHYETAGSLEGGKRVYLLARMPNFELLGDDIEHYLFFMNSHSGKSGIIAGVTNVRVVCNNTLQLAIKTAPRIWKTKHMGDMNMKMREAQIALAMATEYENGVKIMAEQLAKKRIDTMAFNSFLDLMFPIDLEASERVQRNVSTIRNNVMDIYMNKDDLANFRNTAWGLYNAVADVVSNMPPLRMTSTFREKKLAAFMDGEAMLAKAQELLVAA